MSPQALATCPPATALNHISSQYAAARQGGSLEQAIAWAQANGMIDGARASHLHNFVQRFGG